MRSFSVFLILCMFLFSMCAHAAVFFTASIDTLEKYKYIRSDSVLNEIKLLEKTKLSQFDKERISVLKASIFARQGKVDTAFTMFNKLITNEKLLINKVALADAYSGVARIWEQKRNIDKMIYYSVKALTLGRELTNYGIINVAANDIGYGYIFKDKYDSAAFYFHISYDANQLLGDSLRMASCKNNLFVSYFRLGQFEKAVASLIESLKIKENFPDHRSYLSGMLNLTDVYIKLEQFPEAKSAIQKAIAGCKIYKFYDLEVKFLSNYGSILSIENQADSALIYHRNAMLLSDSIGLEFEKGKALRNMGSAYVSLGNDQLAIKYGLEALVILKKFKALRSIGFAENNLAISYLNLNKPHLAKDHIFEALRISNEIDELELRTKVNKTLSRYFETVGNYKKALEHFRSYKQFDDSLNSLSTKKAIHELEAKYESEKKENEIIRLTGENQLKLFELAEKAQKIRQNRTIVASIISVGILMLLIIYLFFNRYKLRQRNLQIKLQRQKLEIEHRMLRSQMNPHFIFNSLNSINSLIMSNDVEQANAYLLKFSGLMRSILENSRNEFIALSDEITMMKLYAQVEQLRHQASFDIRFEDDIEESEFVAIPPMLMQPFLENAIKHAFNGITYRGSIIVKHTIIEDQLICTVEDNGVGINQKQLNNNSIKAVDHKSLAMSLVENRILILKKEWDKNIQLRIDDISKTEQSGSGTKVTLILPVKNL